MTDTPRTRQLPLPFRHRPDYAAADFLAAPSNEAALAWLDRMPEWPDRRLALWGDPGCGKTHLLRIWADRHGATMLTGADLPAMPDARTHRGVAIDDADRPHQETALLHMLNACRDAGVPVLLAAEHPPARWPVRLPDLASRLRAITAVEIAPPEDTLLRALLARLLADRQLSVAPFVQDWLLLRLPRTAAAMGDAVAALDEAALAAGGRITRALAAATLHLRQTDDNSPDDPAQALAGAGNPLTCPEKEP